MQVTFFIDTEGLGFHNDHPLRRGHAGGGAQFGGDLDGFPCGCVCACICVSLMLSRVNMFVFFFSFLVTKER